MRVHRDTPVGQLHDEYITFRPANHKQEPGLAGDPVLKHE
jgi:hypothetical protein